jgi:hypothetical protein
MTVILQNVKPVGRYRNVDTGKEVNVKVGRVFGRSVDLHFYEYRRTRQYISDRDFYGGVWEKID